MKLSPGPLKIKQIEGLYILYVTIQEFPIRLTITEVYKSLKKLSKIEPLDFSVQIRSSTGTNYFMYLLCLKNETRTVLIITKIYQQTFGKLKIIKVVQTMYNNIFSGIDFRQQRF